MQKDIRGTHLYAEAETLMRTLRGPQTGLISDAAEISTDGLRAVFAGTLVDTLDGVPPTRICMTELSTGDTRVLTFGPHIDRSPKFSPDGRSIAFLSDRHQADDYQLYILDVASGAVRPAAAVEGWVEYLHWSPDGRRVLLGVAGHGADVAGAQGAVTSKQARADRPTWLPTVAAGDEDHRWRHAWVYEFATDTARRVGAPDSNVWEAAWCGNESIVAVSSPGPGEGLWYSACLQVIDLTTATAHEIFRPTSQLGCPASSPSGEYIAVVEAICSDRWVVAGDLRLINRALGTVHPVDTCGVDIAYTEWRSDRQLLVAGHRGFETVIGLYEQARDSFSEVWSSQELTTAGRYVSVAGFGDTGDCVLVGESFTRAPEIATIREGEYRAVKSLAQRHGCATTPMPVVERVHWNAPDGLEIQGWVLRPAAEGPHPLIMNIHGGPVWHSRPTWLGRGGAAVLMLLNRGYAIFLPNPRGGTGRGQEFTRHVLGDMGGAETQDFLSGLDYLVERRVADAQRLGVMGGSYGGFMTSWLLTQDTRFAAAVSLAPTTNHVTQHLISNIPHFVSLFLGDTYDTPGGKYFTRSPIMYAHRVKTPTLNICGALDRCTPPEEAVQFHNALLENSVHSVLITYPEEGHGIRRWPAAIDYTVRVVAWFEKYMPAH